MKIYQKYIIKHILKIMFLIILMLCCLSLFIYWIKFVHMLKGRDLAFSLWIKAMVFILPEILFYITPLALFIASVLTYVHLIDQKELIIFESSGVSRLKLVYPAMMVGVFFTLLGFLLSFYIAPKSYQKFLDAKYNIINSVYLDFKEKLFYTLSQDVTIYFEKKNSDRSFNGLIFHNKSNKDNMVTIFSEKATKIKEDYKSERVFLLENGILESENLLGEVSLLEFDKFVINVSNYVNVTKVKKHHSYYINELLFPKGVSEAKKKLFIAEGHNNIVWSIFNFLLLLVGVTVIVSSQFDPYGKFFNMLVSAISIFIIISFFIGAKDVAISHSNMVFLMYLPTTVMLFFCYYILYVEKNIRITEYVFYTKQLLYKFLYKKR